MTTPVKGDHCQICSTWIEDYDPKMCCSGHECGCMGQPTEPRICSSECHDKLMARYKQADPRPMPTSQAN